MRTTTLKDFKKEKVIGKGSFGSVYLVRRVADNKIYALKTVILDKLNKKEQENSVNEVRILASINHPNVIGYKEAFWDDKSSSLNIVMEFADDGDLQSKIIKMKSEGGFFKESLIWEYSIQMVEGLKALHDKKIMHRDLKSANIFLFKENHKCKLGDMNVSKVIKEKVLLTQTGTPYYASPEVWRDEPYSYKSDLWSIGCVIYELCELHPPFRGKDLDELFEDVCKGEPKRINKLYSNDLWNMIKMLLQVDVEKRVDCNMFLKSKLIEDKIEEMKNNPSLYNVKGINLDFNDEGLQKSLLNTIKFSNLNEIKYQLPMTKNYNSMHIPNDSKGNKVNSHNIKSPIVKKSPSLNKKSSRNRNSNKKLSINNNFYLNNKDKDENNTLLMKLKEIQMKKESIQNKLVKQIKSKKNREKNRSLNIDNTNDKLKNQSSQRLNVAKNEIKREIKTEQNSDQKIYSSKLIYNKSEIFDKKSKFIINQIKRLHTDNSKGSIFKSNRLIHVGVKDNLKIKIPKNNSGFKHKSKKIPNINVNNNNILSEYLKKNYGNIAVTPSRQLVKEKRNNIPINYYYNKLLKNSNGIPISISSSNINHTQVNNCCQSFDGNKEIYKPIKSITQNNNNIPNSNIINIPIGNKNKYKKEYKLKKISPNFIRRKNTYTNQNGKFIRERQIIKIQSIFIKRNKSVNFDTKNLPFQKNNIYITSSLRKYNSIKSLHKNSNHSDIFIKDNSFNSLNSKSKIINSSYEKIVIPKNIDINTTPNINTNSNIKPKDENKININIKINKNIIKTHVHHQKYPTITSVQQSIMNNFNKYKNISSNIKMKKMNNNRTLSNQLNLHKNILNSNGIRYKKINPIKKNTNNNSNRKHNQTEITSVMNYIDKSINNSDLTDDNFDKSTINKTTINKSSLPIVEVNNFLKKMKPCTTNENESNNYKKIVINSNVNKLNNYLSPKNNNSQIFNNYYSFNNVETTSIPVKVINIYKK